MQLLNVYIITVIIYVILFNLATSLKNQQGTCIAHDTRTNLYNLYTAIVYLRQLSEFGTMSKIVQNDINNSYATSKTIVPQSVGFHIPLGGFTSLFCAMHL